ncbi:hypothetical protein G9A89_001939 [Geosiphon pyriformis]|nr:hypothetical protein G9A89_001939 [Geosiphon pyriformis]
MKKVARNSGAGGGFRPVLSKKKRKGGVLVESVLVGRGVVETASNHFRHSETGDTTESKSIDMEEECLVEKTSIDYGKSVVFEGGDPNQTLKSLGIKIKTKKVLDKPLGKINFEDGFDDDDFLDESALFLLSLLLKPSIHVFVYKSFALDIDLEKVNFVRKIFSGVNGLRGPLPSQNLTIMVVVKMANDRGVMVNTDLKQPVNKHTDQAIVIKEIPVSTSIEAVHTVVAKFGVIKSIKMQLMGLVDMDKQTWDSRDVFRALLYTLLVGTNAHNLWNFIGSVDRKTCVIDHNSISYFHARCATVCFDSENSLVWAIAQMPVIKGCSVCNGFGHTSLACHLTGMPVVSKSKRAPLSAQDQLRLARIYEKKSAPVPCPLAFGGRTWTSVVNKPLLHVSFGDSFQSGSVFDGKPAPHLNALVLVVSQSSSESQPLVTPPLQDQVGNVVMREDSSAATGGETVAIPGSIVSLEIKKLESFLAGLSASVMSLTAYFDDLAMANSVPPILSSQ